MPTAKEIVAANPELRKMRQSARFLTYVTAGLIVAGIVLRSQLAGKVLGAVAVLMLTVSVRRLLLLGRRIEAIQKGPQPPVPDAPPFFGGFMGGLGLMFVLVAGAAAVVTVFEIFGVVRIREVWWLPPFFALLFGFVGLLNAGIGFAMAKSKARSEFLRQTGLRGRARILNVRETGVTVNDSPQVECTLQVSLPGEPDYTCSVNTVVPLIKLGLLTSPAPVTVCVNPTDRRDVLVEW